MKSGSHFGVTPEYKWWQGLPIVSEASEHASSTLPETLPDMDGFISYLLRSKNIC